MSSQNIYKGTIHKLKTSHGDVVSYALPLGGKDQQKIELNPLIGKKIKLEFTKNIYCVDTGKKLKKAFGQGYSWESFVTLPECDICAVKPEMCHYSIGTCRDEKWGEEHCMKPHIIYLANTGQLKVGITRKANIPHRWMDQGASFALPILEVKDRRTSGQIEVEIAKKMGDKTNWRKMLKNERDEVDLVQIRDQVFEEFASLIEKHKAKKLDEDVLSFQYPAMKFPEKVVSLNLNKRPVIEAVLMAIKGQYLIFDCGAINMRKHQGYEISLAY